MRSHCTNKDISNKSISSTREFYMKLAHCLGKFVLLVTGSVGDTKNRPEVKIDTLNAGHCVEQKAKVNIYKRKMPIQH